MTTKKVEVTLSRAHKVAERLKQAAAAFLASSETLANPVYFDGRAPNIAERLTANSLKSMADAQAAERYLQAWAGVRNTVAAENVKREIHQLLASSEVNNKLLVHYNSLLTSAQGMGTERSAIASIRSASPGENLPSISVKSVGAEELDFLRKKVADLQKRSYYLSDLVAERNAQRVSLELPEDIEDEIMGTN